MFDIFRKRRISRYSKDALTYVYNNYEYSARSDYDSGVRHSYKKTDYGDDLNYPKYSRELDGEIRHSYKKKDYLSDNDKSDNYDSVDISKLMYTYRITGDADTVLKSMNSKTNRTFVDEVIRHIRIRNLRDSEVYKAADIDRRLFSKMMSDRNYKPSKDTALAIAFALYLSLNETKDLLERAGYALSHSNRRDIVIEYFFVEEIYKISDINEVLYNLGEKPLGR